MTIHVLAGDIGGTRARFAIFEVSGAMPRLVHQDTLESRSYRTFEACLKDFLDRGRLSIAAASMGIAGPVVDQRVKTTNLPWTIDARSLTKRFAIEKVTLLNDLVAAGLGAIASPPKNVVSVYNGRPKTKGGNLAVIAAGTGLGEAMFIWDGDEHIACATEGGHTDFAPRNGVEDELLAYLRAEYGRVSYERIASGSTISVVHRFFVQEQRVKESKDAAAKVANAEDPNVAIVELALSGKSEAATRALDLWCSVYGSEAGNLALKSLSTAGVFLCGGVSGSLASVLASGLPSRKKRKGASPFIEAFLDKGRLRPVVEAIPVAVCMEKKAGLLGAATHAASAALADKKKKTRSR
ncbi:MAG: glucokinase [Labilithrix sp.]|nr:glucokinase [Labilithrix sp.]MCW5816622.1 glucokinase [Labilithrix sp.]